MERRREDPPNVIPVDDKPYYPGLLRRLLALFKVTDATVMTIGESQHFYQSF